MDFPALWWIFWQKMLFYTAMEVVLNTENRAAQQRNVARAPEKKDSEIPPTVKNGSIAPVDVLRSKVDAKPKQ